MPAVEFIYGNLGRAGLRLIKLLNRLQEVVDEK
jgi:hypothetical protein